MDITIKDTAGGIAAMQRVVAEKRELVGVAEAALAEATDGLKLAREAMNDIVANALKEAGVTPTFQIL
jgi:hypothetical protein